MPAPKPQPKVQKPKLSAPRHDPSKAKPYEVQPMDVAAEKRKRGMSDERTAPATRVSAGPPLSERSRVAPSRKAVDVPRVTAPIATRGPINVTNTKLADRGGYLKDSLGRPVRTGGDGSKVRVEAKPRGRG